MANPEKNFGIREGSVRSGTSCSRTNADLIHRDGFEADLKGR